MPLSDVQIRSLKPRDRIYKISDANSLYLEVHPTGARLWRFKYSWHGKQKRIALGAYPNVGLAEARCCAILNAGGLIGIDYNRITICNASELGDIAARRG